MVSQQVQAQITSSQQQLATQVTEVKRLQAEAERISNVEKKRVSSALRQDIIRQGERADALKQRISALKASETVPEAQRRIDFARAQTVQQEAIRQQRGIDGRVESQIISPTATEQALGMSLPTGIRELEVQQARTFVQTGAGPQTLAPISFGAVEERGRPREAGVLTTREEEVRVSPSVPFAEIPRGVTAETAVGLGAALGAVSLPRPVPGAIAPESAQRRAQQDIALAQDVFFQQEALVSRFQEDPSSFAGTFGVETLGTPEGQQVTLTEEFFRESIDLSAAQARAERKAAEQLARRTPAEISASRFQEFAIGGAQLGIGVAEFGVNIFSQLGVQTFEERQAPQIFGGEDRGFRFGGTLGAIREAPKGFGTLLGKTAVIAPLVVAGGAQIVRDIRGVGFAETAKETAIAFSPFKIPTRTFGALEGVGAAEGLKFDVASFKIQRGDLTGRVVLGRGEGGVELISRQLSTGVPGGEIGFARTTIQAPTITVSRGGGFVPGFRAVQTESIIRGAGGEATFAKGIPGFRTVQPIEGLGPRPRDIAGFRTLRQLESQGFGGDISTRRVGDILVRAPRGEFELTGELFPKGEFTSRQFVGGISRGLDEGITAFGAGPARRIVIPKGERVTQRIFTPSGEEIKLVFPERISRGLRVDAFNIRGLEFDLGKIQRGGIGDIGIPSTGVGPRGIGGLGSPEVVAKQLSASLGALPKPARVTPRPTGAIPTVVTETQFPSIVQFGGRAQSIFAGGGQDVISDGVSIGVLAPPRGGQVGGFGPLVEPDFRNLLGVGVGVDISGRQRGRLRPSLGLGFREVQAPALRVEQAFAPAQATRQRTRQRTTQEQIFGAPTGRGFDFGFVPFRPGIPVGGLGLPPLRRPPTLRDEFGFTRGRARRPGRIAPSLTGLISFDLGDITGPLPTGEGPLGVLPGQTRFVPRAPRKKKKKR